MSILFLLCLIILTINIISDPLILKFSSRFSIDDENDVMKSLINNYIYTSFIVGSNKQQMEMSIRTQKGSTFLVSASCTDNAKAKKFNHSESVSYNETFPKKTYYMYEYEGAVSTDDFIIYQNNNVKIEMKDYKFMLVNRLWDSYQEYLGGMIGLLLQTSEVGQEQPPEQTDFIKKKKKKNKTNSYVFTLVYEDDFNGKLYVGDYLHEFNKSYSKNDFISTKAGIEDSKVRNWDINIEKIFSENTLVQSKTYLRLYYEYGIIAGTESYKAYINQTFFKNYYEKGICQEKLNLESMAAFDKYKYIVCDKNNFDKTSFQNLSFYNVEMNMNFTLSHEDLFYEYKNKIYFLIIFPIYGITVDYWLMGKPFIKKYKLSLDKDKKIIGLYLNYTESQGEEQEREGTVVGDGNRIKYIVIIIILSLVLIIAIGSLLYYFLVYKKSRKKRANELVDDTDYIAQEENKEEKNMIN